MSGNYIGEQVAAFFTERGIEPLVSIGNKGAPSAVIHGKLSHQRMTLCTPSRRLYEKGKLRAARGRDFLRRPCPACLKQYRNALTKRQLPSSHLENARRRLAEWTIS
jgi:glycine/D-amino acid oxidase-like deaminating enzyme